MDCEIYFKDLFESVSEYRKLLLMIFLIKIDTDFLTECRLLKNGIIRFRSKFLNLIIEQYEEHLNYIENQEESTIEKILNK